MSRRLLLLPAALAIASATLASAAAAADVPATVDPLTVHVFHRAPVRWAENDPGGPITSEVTASDHGRAVERTLDLPRFDRGVRILARVRLHPVPKDASSVCDKWDRAGNVTLVRDDGPDVEIVKFVTAYGGRTEHEVDVTRLAPLLTGRCRFRGSVDTWVSPAWTLDFELVFEPVDPAPRPAWMDEWLEEDRGAPDWCIPVAYETLTRERMDAGDVTARVTVPAGTEHVVLHYLVSGHCTDGTDADEFVSKDNVISVDGAEAYRFRPWRDDCRRFRDVNPYCRRWFDGSWSADYSRSGWCPGDVVLPEAIDLTDALAPGDHEIAVRVESIRPADESGYGVWRVSAVLTGWGGRGAP